MSGILNWKKGGVLSATQLNKISSSLSFEEQELTTEQKAQARENIDAAATSDIKDIFWVTYNTTTAAQINAALTAGKLPILKFRYGDGDTDCDFLILTHSDWTFYRFCSPVYQSVYRTATLADGVWSNALKTAFPDPPTTAGNYTLKVTVSNNRASYDWEAAE